MIVVLLILVCLKSTETDNPLENIDLKTRIGSNYPKLWLSYTHALLVHSKVLKVKNYKLTVFMLHSLFRQSSVEKYLRTSELFLTEYTHQPHHEKSGIFTEWTSPLILFEAQVKERNDRLDKNIWYRNIYTYHFELHKELQLQITILKLNIYNKRTNRCYPLLNIVNRRRGYDGKSSPRGFQFCGIKSNFVVYLDSSSIHFNVVFTNTAVYYVRALFDLRSPGLITTNVADYTVRRVNFTIFNHNIRVVTEHVHLWHLMTKAKTTFAVRLSNPEKTGFVYLYQGPGFKSNKVIITTFPAVIPASSFQCFLHSNVPMLLQYVVNLLPVNKFYKEVVNESTNLKLDLSTEGTFQFGRVYQSNQTFLNISIKHLAYLGDEDSNCQYGGVWFYEIDFDGRDSVSSSPSKISSLCFPVVKEHKSIQNIYSAKRSILLLVYTYKHYSHINMSIQVSQSSCFPIVIDVCDPYPNQPTFVKMNSMQSKGFTKLGRHTIEININATRKECVVLQLHSNTLFHIWKHKPTKCTVLVVLQKDIFSTEHKYKITGYLSEKYLHSPKRSYGSFCPFFTQNQYFIVGGKNFIQPKTTISVVQEKDGKEQPLSADFSPCMFDKNRTDPLQSQFYQQTGLKPVLYLNPTSQDSVLFQLSLHSLTPTSDMGLVFMYQPLSIRSWVEIVFFASEGQKVPKEAASRFIHISDKLQSVQQLFRAKVLQIGLKLPHKDMTNVLLDINVLMRVSGLEQFRSLKMFLALWCFLKLESQAGNVAVHGFVFYSTQTQCSIKTHTNNVSLKKWTACHVYIFFCRK